MEENQKKLVNSYNYFFGWIVVFLAGTLVLSVMLQLADHWIGKDFSIRAVLIYTLGMIIGLFYMIYQTGRIYYYNGISYDDAVQAGEIARRTYAAKHLEKMVHAGAVYMIYVIGGMVLSVPAKVDIVVFTGVVLWGAFSTLKIKLVKNGESVCESVAESEQD